MSSILVLNPNSSRAMTEAMLPGLAPLQRAGGPAFTAACIAEAPEGINSDAEVAFVSPLVADHVAKASARAVIVSCFSDPGLKMARAARPDLPVLGIGESAYHAALALGQRFGVVSLAAPSVARHAVYIEALGLTGRLAGDRAIGMDAVTASDPHKAEAAVIATARQLVEEDGADVLILGCAGMGQMRGAVQAALGVPVVDPVQAAAAQALTMLDLGYRDFSGRTK